MLTYSSGVKQAPSAAAAYARHLLEQTLPAEEMALAEYYVRGTGTDEALSQEMGAVPTLRHDVDPRLADALGVKAGQFIDANALANVLSGNRADGFDLPLGTSNHRDVRTYDTSEGRPERHRVAYFDFCFSAPKSVSLAWAFADTAAERASILQAHRSARDEALAYVEKEIGRAYLGDGRGGATEAARLAWITVDHFTARPTVDVTRPDPVTGTIATELHTVPIGNTGRVAGDPQLHTHCVVPNLIVSESGRLVALHGQLLANRVHEFGAVYQMILAREMRALGIDMELDARTKTAKVSCIPDHVMEEFSKRTRDAEGAARAEAARRGMDWDAMRPDDRVAFLKGGAGASRRSKADDLAQFERWKEQAERIGWSHKSAMAYGPPAPERKAEERLDAAYRVSEDLFSGELARRAVVLGSDARLAAARGLIAEGAKDANDVSAVTSRMVKGGVVQDGVRTRLRWLHSEGRATRLTTDLHVAQERELIALAQKAASDKRGSLTTTEIDAAAKTVGVEWKGRAGEEQRAAAHAMGQSGHVGVFIGIAGVGKSRAVLPPLVKAWEEHGHEIWGVALGWRQARELEQGGIAHDRAKALQPFLDLLRDNRITLTDKSVVVLDEVGQVGTRQLLDLMRHRDRLGFKVVMAGDERQCQAIEAGPVIDLLRNALGKEAVPEILTTVRQRSEAERETATMFREGRATEALDRKRADGSAELVPGGYQAAVDRVAHLAMERRAANAADPDFTLTISAPTNVDAHNIGLAMRALRREAGEITGPDTVRAATDGAGNAYSLPLAVGDRVRLFATTRAVFEDERGIKRSAVIGDNGSVRDVLALNASGLKLRNPETGKTGFVAWSNLTDPGSGRVKLALGEALTIHSSQGLTSDEHISALPGGSKAVQGYQAYVAASRHRVANYIVGSMGAEQREMTGRRAIGGTEPTGDAMVTAAWANVARNLKRQPIKESAILFMEGAARQATRAAEALQSGLRKQEAGEVRGHKPTLRETFDQAQAASTAQAIVTRLDTSMQQRTEVLDQVRSAIGKEVSRRPEQKPREGVRHVVNVSESEAAQQLKDTLRERYGITVKGSIVFDGRMHLGDVRNVKGNLKKGSAGYRAVYQGGSAAGSIWDWTRGGYMGVWSAKGELKPISEAEWKKRAEETAQRTSDELRKTLEQADRAAVVAERVWRTARPADPHHPYLVAKEVQPHGIRQNARGHLVVPLRDTTGRLRNIQWIAAPGEELIPGTGKNKKYLAGAQKSGVFFITGDLKLGDLPHGVQLGAAEGFATAGSAAELSGKPVAMVMDTSNIGPALRAIRAAQPDRPIWIAADNDHALPLRPDKPLPNYGKEKAEKAAAEVGAKVVLAPELPEQAAKKQGTDWNDYRVVRGLEAARGAFRNAWTTAKNYVASKSSAPAIPPQVAEAHKQRQGSRAHM